MDPVSVTPAPVLKARLKTGLSSLVPRTHARNLELLRATYPGLSPDELAQRLVNDAARHSAAVGTAAACCAFAPVPGSAPLATAGESAAASALRTRLTAELHTVYGLLDPSPVNEGSTGHLTQWAAREGGRFPPLSAVPALALAATRALPKRLRRYLPRPRVLLTASAVTAGLRCGGVTRRYGEALRRDLRADPTAWSQWPDEPLVPDRPSRAAGRRTEG
jgi:hypothetical protein